MQFRPRFLALLAVTVGTVTLADTPLSAMPFGAAPASLERFSPQAEPARLVCNRRRCWRTYGYRRWYRPYYGYRYYRPYYFGLPGLGVRVY